MAGACYRTRMPDDDGRTPPEEPEEGAEVIRLEDFRKAAEKRPLGGVADDPEAALPSHLAGFVAALGDALSAHAEDEGQVHLDLTQREDRRKAVELLRGVGAAIRDNLAGHLGARAEATEVGEDDESVGGQDQPEPAAPPPEPAAPDEANSRPAGPGEPGVGRLLRALLGGLVGTGAAGGITVNVNINLPGASVAPQGGGTPGAGSAGEGGGDEKGDSGDGTDDGGDE